MELPSNYPLAPQLDIPGHTSFILKPPPLPSLSLLSADDLAFTQQGPHRLPHHIYHLPASVPVPCLPSVPVDGLLLSQLSLSTKTLPSCFLRNFCPHTPHCINNFLFSIGSFQFYISTVSFSLILENKTKTHKTTKCFLLIPR